VPDLLQAAPAWEDGFLFAFISGWLFLGFMALRI